MKKVFLPWAQELSYQKCLEAINTLKSKSWYSSPWTPVMTLRHKKNGTFIFQSQKEYDASLYEKITEEDHVHCEFCWTSISNFEGDEHSGYKNNGDHDDLSWLCNNCYSKIIHVTDSLAALKKYTKEIQAIDIIMEGNNFNSLEGFFEEAIKKLTHNLDWKPGKSLDAVNDLLRGGFGIHGYGEPIHLHWKNSEKSRKDLGWSETIRFMEKRLKTANRKNNVVLSKELLAAKRHEGQTLFEMIENMIKAYDFIELSME
jgi:hypothetical protein